MSEKVYPYIGKSTETDVVVFFTSKGVGTVIGIEGHGYYKHGDFSREWIERHFENVTREYLANTKIEIESEEHKQSIIDLCSANDIPCTVDSSYATWAAAIDNTLLFIVPRLDNSNLSDLKQIHLPLPPEDVSEKERISTSDEWPQVGDEVVVKIDTENYVVEYGHDLDGMKGIVRSKFKDGTVDVYAVSINGTCFCFVLGLLRKPPTPEEEIANELTEYFTEVGSSVRYAVGGNDLITRELLEKYNITKKEG